MFWFRGILQITIIILAPILVWTISNPETCENGAVLPQAVRIKGCFPCSPCLLFLETGIVIEIDFIAPKILEDPRARAIATIIDEENDFTGDLVVSGLDKVCDFLIGGECPLAAGDRVTFQLHFPIVPYFPLFIPVNLTIVLEETGTTITCFRFPALLANNIDSF